MNQEPHRGTYGGWFYWLCVQSGHTTTGNTMKNVLLATFAILAFAAPSFAAETAKEPAKTVGQAAHSFYLAQDSTTLKCQIVEAQPAAGGSMKVVGAAHSTMASAETALKADKTCVK